MVSMAYLASEEFTEPERKWELGTLNWPEWHFGVLSMYGHTLAMNHLIAMNQMSIVRLNESIDYPSGNEQSVFNVLHIHVYHGESMFSKFAFKDGKYDFVSFEDFDVTDQSRTYKYNQVKWFCLKTALEGRRIKADELHRMLVSATSNKR
jgi:hypothetical protein